MKGREQEYNPKPAVAVCKQELWLGIGQQKMILGKWLLYILNNKYIKTVKDIGSHICIHSNKYMINIVYVIYIYIYICICICIYTHVILREGLNKTYCLFFYLKPLPHGNLSAWRQPPRYWPVRNASAADAWRQKLGSMKYSPYRAILGESWADLPSGHRRIKPLFIHTTPIRDRPTWMFEVLLRAVVSGLSMLHCQLKITEAGNVFLSMGALIIAHAQIAHLLFTLLWFLPRSMRADAGSDMFLVDLSMFPESSFSLLIKSPQFSGFKSHMLL